MLEEVWTNAWENVGDCFRKCGIMIKEVRTND